MSSYEIKTEERRFTLATMADVVEAVRTGRLGRAAMIREAGTKTWARIDSMPELVAVLETDLWSAWDEDSDDSLLDDFQQPEESKPGRLAPAPTLLDEVEELPAASVEPVGIADLDAAADDVQETEIFQRPQPITPAKTTHPRSPRRPPAKVIDFPTAQLPSIEGVHALDLRAHHSPAKAPPPRRSVRWGPIIILGTVATAAMFLWVWFVNINADADFAPRKRAATETSASLGAPLAEAEVEEVISPYDTLEDLTREQMMEGILDIPGETEFEDALLIELRRVRVDVRSVRVKIDSWAGRKNDVPDGVTFNLKVMARDGELDRDLGALGLVMGKYIQHYGLQVNALNIILGADDGLRKLQMNPETARRYFTHRVSLERFLSTAFDAQ